MSFAECKPGALVWVPNPASSSNDALYQQGRVLAVDETSCTVRTDTRVVQLDLLTAAPMMVNQESMAPDMTSLHHIHEPAILANLKSRSLHDEPYTYISSVLIAINPLRPMPDPFPPGSGGNSITNNAGSLIPHPYVVAELAYQQMLFRNSLVRNQSIVIAGESGAGKTESAKMVLAHLVSKTAATAAAASTATISLDKRLLGTNPILEAFGNASTLRNPNSSRFGKMLRLHFANSDSAAAAPPALLGATVQSYLLERSRVTSHEAGERTFHVMYQLVAGADAQLQQDLHLGGRAFRYMQPAQTGATKTTTTTASASDQEHFRQLVQSLASIGVDDARPVLAILAGVLHLGEITFVDANEGAEVAAAGDAAYNPLRVAAELFGLDSVELAKVFCERKLVVQNKTVVSRRTARAAAFTRDAAAKGIYSSLFDWLVKRINASVGSEVSSSSSTTTTTTLGVLDIFGAESFESNSLEQLLINFANESLMMTFNGQIFVAEASLYEKEGLFGANECMARPSDNGLCVEFLQGKAGLLATIDSEGRAPDPSDVKMLQRIHTLFGKHAAMVKPHPKDVARQFIVRHYCGQVTYTVGSFLEKNNDGLPTDLEQFLATGSSGEVMRDMFMRVLPPVQGGGAGRAPPPARSISSKFTSQIKNLVDDLESTRCSFIRCVKPNASMFRSSGDASWFDERYVQMQLHALNVPQTCEVLRNGFPTRLDYSVLVDLYWNVLPAAVLARYGASAAECTQAQQRAFCRALLFAFAIAPESYKLGKTKVFFKAGKLAELDGVLKATGSGGGGGLDDNVLLRFRLCFIRGKWRRLLLAAQALEKFNAMFVRARRQSEAATKLQTVVRRHLARRKYVKLQRGALTVQSLWRGRKARALASALRQEKIREQKRLAELAEKTKREREEAAKQALLLEIQEEKKRKEAVEQARAVEEALAKQEQEARALEESHQLKRRQSVKIIVPRKSGAVTFKVASGGKRSDISLGGGGGGGEMSSLRSKTLLARRSVGGGGGLQYNNNTGDDDEDDAHDDEDGGERQQQRRRQSSFKAGGAITRQGSITSSAQLRVQRRNKSVVGGGGGDGGGTTPVGAAASSSASSAAVAAPKKSVLIPPKKFAKPYNLREQKTSLEKMSTLAREEFCIKVRGTVLVLLEASSSSSSSAGGAESTDEDNHSQSGGGSGGGGGLLSKLKSRILRSKSVTAPASAAAALASAAGGAAALKWTPLSYQLDKPARQLMFFVEGAAKVELLVDTTATLRVRTVALASNKHLPPPPSSSSSSDQQQQFAKHVVELKPAANKPPVYVAFGTQEEKRVWERDVREAVIGFRAPVPAAADKGSKFSTVQGDERMGEFNLIFSDQVRQERLAQVAKLYKLGEISQAEFDEACGLIAQPPEIVNYGNGGAGDQDSAEDGAGEQDEPQFGSQVQCPKCAWSNTTMFGRLKCVKCGHGLKKDGGGADDDDDDDATADVQAVQPLQNPFAKEMAFDDGRVAAELIGCERSMDFATYQEVYLFGIDLRFRDEELADLEVGWLVSHRLDRFAALHAALVDATDGPLTPAARKKIPAFPSKLKEDSPTAAEELATWLRELFKLVPQGGKQTDLVYVEDGGADGVDGTDDSAAAAAEHERFTAEWRSVKDVETGDVYYFNKVTGETTWVNPFNVRAMRELKTKLPPNWEAVVDKDTSDVYYWNTVTRETTWEKPQAAALKSSASSRATLSKKRNLLEAKDLLQVAVVNKFLDLKRNAQRLDDMANE